MTASTVRVFSAKTLALRARARQMKLDGMTYLQIGNALGFTHQYATVLVGPPRPALKEMAKRAKGRCEICGKRTKVLQGHHEDYTGDPSIFVCVGCHNRLGKGKMTVEQLKANPAALSERDWDVYRAIVGFKMDHDGCAPQLRELMDLAHMSSTSVVTHHLARLDRAGLIEMSPGRAGRIMVRGGRWMPPKPVGIDVPMPKESDHAAA